MDKSRNIVKGGCECNGHLNPINQKGECEYQASTGCGLWLTSQFSTVIHFIFEKCICVLYKCGQVLCGQVKYLSRRNSIEIKAWVGLVKSSLELSLQR